MTGFEEPVDFGYLVFHWSTAYDITMRCGRYEAARRDDGSVLTAISPELLLVDIRADYSKRPVPRPVKGADR